MRGEVEVIHATAGGSVCYTGLTSGFTMKKALGSTPNIFVRATVAVLRLSLIHI